MHPDLSRRDPLVSGIGFIIGGATWALHALVLSARPEGCIGTQCTIGGNPARSTEDLSWLFLVSVCALAIGMLTAPAGEGTRGRAARVVGTGLVLAGVAALGLGLAVNAAVKGDSPLWWLHDSDSLGRLLPMLGSLAAATAALRGHWLERWHGVLLVLSVIASLGFNAQTDRILLAVPIGVAWTVIGMHELHARHRRRSSRA